MAKTSPFSGIHKQLGARFEHYHGWDLPADFGDINQELQALKESCAVVDLSGFERLTLKGKFDRKLLNTLFTQKSGKLFPDTWIWVKTDDEDAPAIFRAAMVNSDCILLTQPGQGDTVARYISTVSDGSIEAANISDNLAMLGLYGPESFEVVKSLLPFDIDGMDPGEVAKKSVFMMSFTLLRGSWLASEGLELICSASTGPMAAGAIAKYRHKKNIIPAGMDSLKNAMQAVQWPV